MGLIVKMKLRKQRKARELLAARLRLEIVEIRNAREAHRVFFDRCPKGDAFCQYRESIRHASLALAQAEKDVLERLNTVDCIG
jgi:hypothetical protein